LSDQLIHGMKALRWDKVAFASNCAAAAKKQWFRATWHVHASPA